VAEEPDGTMEVHWDKGERGGLTVLLTHEELIALSAECWAMIAEKAPPA
jgi:hypothetical protein